MALALNEAKKGLGFVSPNPPVGCVILDKDMNFLASGYHHAVGQNHAEIDALSQITDPQKLNGAHLYVTLEPCAHEGRTPSCAKALAKLPIASVNYGLVDPHPQVSGEGLKILQKAGIQVNAISAMKQSLEELVEIFFLNQTKKRPFVALKVASSLDGQMGLHTGESQWITGELARERVQYLRGIYDAILIGIETFLQDSPRLNSRLPEFSNKINWAVLLDPEARSVDILANSPLAQVRPLDKILIFTKKENAGKSWPPNCSVKAIQTNSLGFFNLREVLQIMYDVGICSVFLEGGAKVYSTFLADQFVDRIYVFQNMSLLGGGSGVSWSQDLSIATLKDRIHLDAVQSEQLSENDWLFSGKPKT